MELLYNPDVMSEAELKATFVGREALLHDLFELVRSQPEGAGVQHAVIIAPRGMGKTAVLQRLRYMILESDLAETWLPLKFPEELYGVADLADFWLETLRLLSIDTHQPALQQKSQDLPGRFTQRGDVAEAAFALIKDFRRTSGKRLLLQVENLDDLLENIGSEQDSARLRDILMNDGTVMLAGSAVKFFKQARAYDQPLYNFFRIFDLNELSFDESQRLLSRRGEQDGKADFAETLQANSARLRALHHFTQGIPRLVLMLYRVLAQSDVGAVRQALEKLLDEVTPYYKARVEVLPAQLRKLLEHVARAAARTHEGVSPTELAEAVHLPVNQVSSQLKRLVEAGYLRTAPLRGRRACYVLSEPLYALWHQMRLNPETRVRKLVWLVDFLQQWYDDRERVEEAERLFQLYEDSERSGDGPRAIAVMEHLDLLARSASRTPVAGQVQRLAARSLSRLRDKRSELGASVGISDDRVDEQLANIEETLRQNPNDAGCWVAKGSLLMWEKQEYELALRCFDRAVDLDSSDAGAWLNRGTALYFLNRYEDSLASRTRALELDPNNAVNWNNRGVTLDKLGRYTEALTHYERALELDPQDNVAKRNRSLLFTSVEDDFLEAIAQDKPENARELWDVLRALPDLEANKQILKRGILFTAELGHLAFARELIGESALQEEFFPLDRALEYLHSKDEALIEKLSPEIKEAVRAVVNDLRISLQRETKSETHPFSRVKTLY